MSISVTVDLKCDACKRAISVAGRTVVGRRRTYIHVDDIYVLSTGDVQNALTVQRGAEIEWLKENASEVKVACSNACVARLLPYWLNRLDKEYEP